jgi:hypothetical protein
VRAIGASWSNNFDGDGWSFNGFEEQLPMYTYQSKGPQKNYANLQTNENGTGHSAIVGKYGENDFQITVGTGSDNMSAILSGVTAGGNSCPVSGRSIPLIGANIASLYRFSQALNWMGNHVPYNAIVANCAFYTSMAMNFAGVNNIYMIFPRMTEYQLQATNGWGF